MCELWIINELFWIKQKLASGVASLLFGLCGGQTVKGCRKERAWESDNTIRQNRCHILATLSSNPQAASGQRVCGKRRKWQYVPWSLLSVGESSCRRKNLTSCFRGPHFCRCSYIMCSKGIARSEETAVEKREKKKRLFLRTCVAATWMRHFNLYEDQHKCKNYNLLFCNKLLVGYVLWELITPVLYRPV